jgi:hypothetical protein
MNIRYCISTNWSRKSYYIWDSYGSNYEKLSSSGMWHRVVWYKFIDVSEEFTASKRSQNSTRLHHVTSQKIELLEFHTDFVIVSFLSTELLLVITFQRQFLLFLLKCLALKYRWKTCFLFGWKISKESFKMVQHYERDMYQASWSFQFQWHKVARV